MQSPEALDNEIAQLESAVGQQILQLSARICSPHRMHKMLVPIHLLPAELLSRIFLFVREQATGDSTWIFSTLVCRVWRSVAIACATLWTDIDFIHPERAEEMLKRSKSVPLNIKSTNIKNRMHPRDHDFPCLPLRNALSNIDRAQTVMLTECPLDDLKGSTELLWPVTAPSLWSLTILGYHDLYEPYNHPLPLSFLHGSFPKLRKLHLRGLSIPWHAASHFNGLTELKIAYFKDTDTLAPSLSELMAALQKMTSLLHLALSLPCLRASEAKIVPVERPRLDTLELEMEPSSIVDILTTISHPRNRLEIVSSARPVEGARALIHCVNRYRIAKIQEGYTMDTSYVEANLRGFRLDICDPARVGSACPLQVMFRADEIPIPDLLATVLSESPLRDMKTVMVSSLDGFIAARPCLRQCETLCASFIEDEEFFNSRNFYHWDGEIWLPSMQTLMLHDIEMYNRFMSPEAVTIRELVGFLGNIGRNGEALQTLKFISCHSSRQIWLAEIREYVHHLEVQSPELDVVVRSQDLEKDSATVLKAVFGRTSG